MPQLARDRISSPTWRIILPMYNILWEFLVKSGSEAEFERHYGNQGTWAQFFQRGNGYKGSHLFRDVSNSSRYLTLDQWESSEYFHAFEAEHREEYQSIDKVCESLTLRENRLAFWTSE